MVRFSIRFVADPPFDVSVAARFRGAMPIIAFDSKVPARHERLANFDCRAISKLAWRALSQAVSTPRFPINPNGERSNDEVRNGIDSRGLRPWARRLQHDGRPRHRHLEGRPEDPEHGRERSSRMAD